MEIVNFNYLGLFFAGTLTLLSPCILPLIPIYFSILLEGIESTRLNLLSRSSIFSLGFLIIYVILGLSASSIGQVLTNYKLSLYLLSSFILIIFALHLLKIIKFNFLNKIIKINKAPKNSNGFISSFILGIVFALGWSPCAGPIIGAVLTYTATTSNDPLIGASYLLSYGLGISIPLILLSLFIEHSRALIKKINPYLPKLEKLTGLIILLLALNMIYSSGIIELIFYKEKTAQGKTIILPEDNQGIRVIKFYSSGCDVCKQMEPIIEKIKKHCSKNNVDLVSLNIDQAQNRLLSIKYGVSVVPTFVFFDRNGKMVSKLIGYNPGEKILEHIGMVMGRVCPNIPFDTKIKLNNKNQCELKEKDCE
jgi:cytochrome c-type biogenesis protein